MKRMMFFTSAVMAVLLVSCTPYTEAPDDLDTPQYPVGSPTGEFLFVVPEETHSAADGWIIIPAGDRETSAALTPDTVWKEDNTATYHAYTLPDKVQLGEDGCVGLLRIPAIGLEMPVYETDDMMSTMLKGGAHFKCTSCWDGNIGISAHNSGVPAAISFGRLKELKKGDSIRYETALGVREYVVSESRVIDEDNWDYLNRSSDNRITLITCVDDEPQSRLMVQGVS